MCMVSGWKEIGNKKRKIKKELESVSKNSKDSSPVLTRSSNQLKGFACKIQFKV